MSPIGEVGFPVDTGEGCSFFGDHALAVAGRFRHDGAVPLHGHGCVEIVTVIGGEGCHVSPLGSQRLVPGDVVVLRPGAWHRYEDCRALEVFNLRLDPALLRQELSWAWEDPLLGYLLRDGPYAPKKHGMLVFRLDEDPLERCAGRMDALAKLRGEPLLRYRGDVIGQLTLVLSEMARAADDARDPRELLSTSHCHPTAMQAMRLLESRLGYPWTLAVLAETLHLTPNYLIRIFKSATGLPPMTYLTRYRVETAAILLINTHDSVAEIAATVGWPDQNYFARRFRAHFGSTPSAYRARSIRNGTP
ncbi:AraC family transcriptional regulator, L-rhamnose operon transcriptional activator RhaR [Nonomuraea solani]|uniref:AraC family transcriptional regulator, L-rhamnose operon transcriptional activator RhaR n=1 Tax=Nonomuraea solani TaxID=1144553 RepID=A0A1H6DTQ8_9ACTN|nr:AraC family transcriptional regulator [Nonomuraea solani]SEG88658.1 AraC family transcriptional regulator, L-rhamnose operon transcriptional activator RhaR [Nonomuraea solani]